MPAIELPFETATWGRRIAALIVDYAACWGVMLLIYGWRPGPATAACSSAYLTLLFIVESAFLMALSGGSFGQLRAPGCAWSAPTAAARPRSLLTALLRQVLICLVIPPLVFRPDGRGLHETTADPQPFRYAFPTGGVGSPVRLTAPCRPVPACTSPPSRARTLTRGAREDPMRTLTLRKAALVAALPLALSSLAACGNGSSQASAAADPQAAGSSPHGHHVLPPASRRRSTAPTSWSG